MSRKPHGPNQRASKETTFNQLVKQLEAPDSLINYLPEDMRLAALQIPDEYINLDEDEILKKLKDQHDYEPTSIVEALRNNFWMEYDRVSASRTENVMNMTSIYLGVCSRENLNLIATQRPHQLAYILTRSPQYEAIQAGLLNLATRRIKDILSIPLKTPSGYQDPKVLELILKAAAMVDLRNKGGYLNRSETRNMTMIEQNTKHSYAIFSGTQSSSKQTAAQIQKDIDEKLAALEQEAKELAPPPEPKFTKLPSEEVVVEAEYKEVKSDGRSSV